MLRSCGSCARPYDARTSRSAYCSAKCRQAAARRRRGAQKREQVAALVETSTVDTREDGPTVARIRAELQDCGREKTWQGAAALALAERVDRATAVMGYASLIKQLHATMAEATAGAAKQADEVDEVTARREAKMRRVAGLT